MKPRDRLIAGAVVMCQATRSDELLEQPAPRQHGSWMQVPLPDVLGQRIVDVDFRGHRISGPGVDAVATMRW